MYIRATHVQRYDWVLLGALCAVAGAGLLTLASLAPHLFRLQLVWFALGALAIVFFAAIDVQPFLKNRRVVFALYAASLALLIATLLFGTVIRGAKSWIVAGSFQFQSSELMKLALIIVLSAYFAKAHIGIARPRIIFFALLYAAAPLLLVLLQPDLGTALVLGAIAVGYLLISGIRWRHLALGALLAAVLFVFAWNFLLADYQRARLAGFISPQTDPLGINYNVLQSKIAIGSAGWFGKGFGSGTQSHLGFLPEAEQDFILAAFIEEWGFAGAALLFFAFAILLFRIVRAGMRSEGNFGRLFCLGAASMLLIQFFMNAGSTLGLFPVVGLTLPFMSYGGSSLFTNMLTLGIVQSIALRASYFRT